MIAVEAGVRPVGSNARVSTACLNKNGTLINKYEAFLAYKENKSGKRSWNRFCRQNNCREWKIIPKSCFQMIEFCVAL